MTTPSFTPRAFADFLLLGLIWGASFLAIRIALDELGPLTTVLFRVAPAALALWCVVLIKRLPLPNSPSVWLALVVMGALNNVIPFTLLAWGQQFIETGLTSILNAATAIFGVLFAAVFFADERLSLRKALGVALGFAGVTLAIGPNALAGLDITALAQIAVIGATLSYAIASCWGRANLRALPPMVAAAGMLTGASLLMLPITLIFEGAPSLALQGRTWASIAYYSLAATALAYFLFYRILAVAGAGNLMLVTLVIPPVAIVLGAWVLGEALAPLAYLGFGLIALGLVVIDGRLLRRRSI